MLDLAEEICETFPPCVISSKSWSQKAPELALDLTLQITGNLCQNSSLVPKPFACLQEEKHFTSVNDRNWGYKPQG